MATPFTAFRKYAGAAMAVLCGLLMVSFIVADPLMQMLGGGGNRLPAEAKDTVARWNGGRLNELELGEAVRHRMVLAEFQRQVMGLGFRDADAAGVSDVALRVSPLDLPATLEQGVEKDVVRTKIFAQRAREAGMVVSDEMIIDYLKGLGRDRVSSEQMRTIMGGMQRGAGRRATIQFVFELLREAMLAKNYQVSHQYAFGTVLPGERWEDWLKVNDRVVLEAAPAPVDDFVDRVEEPTDAEIEGFFEEHREREPTPDFLTEYGSVQLKSPLPAFTTPERVRLQYVVAKFDDFTDRLLPEVSDEEVAKFYEDNKDRFIEADRALFGDDDLFGDEAAEDAEMQEDAAPGDDAAEADGAPADTPAAEPSSEAEAAEEGEDAPEDSAPGTGEGDAEATVEEEEEEEAADETEAPAADDDAEAEAPADEDAPSDEESAEDSLDQTLTYQPLEEVSEEIRRRLAQVKAEQRMRELMFELKRELDDHYAGYFDAMLDAADAEADPPAPPEALTDLSPLAEKHGLTLEEAGPIARLDLAETTVGGSLNADPTAPRPFPIYYLAFAEGALDRYEPAVTFDSDNNLYLTVITERLERVTPELDDVRDEVVAAWKRDKAADLALEAARKLADKVGDSGLSIENYLAEKPKAAAAGAFETDPMALLRVAGVSERTGEVFLRLSQPEPLVEPGPDLLETVFALDTGEVGAALNHDRSVAYVLRVASRLTPIDQLRSQFLSEGGVWYGTRALSRVRSFRAVTTVFDSVLEEGAGLEWTRDPDQPVRRGS